MCALETLALKLSQTESIEKRIHILDRVDAVIQFQQQYPFLFKARPHIEELVFKQLIALQDFVGCHSVIEPLISSLLPVEQFYREMGGLIGYQSQILRIIHQADQSGKPASYQAPRFIDITKGSRSVKTAVTTGIEAMPHLFEMYPLGGAADRLHLVDPQTGDDLPAAKLEFAGRTLLSWLFSDLIAREELYFQKTGRRVITPVAIMTSSEKINNDHVCSILEENNYFGRPRESMRLFVQPLVPTVNEKGQWVWTSEKKLLMKPGGHGVMWKLARDNGIFDWAEAQNRKFVLVRQINNPLAGIDYGLLALLGYGVKGKKAFGFASCPRPCLSAEGMNVLALRRSSHLYEYTLSNVEYTDFAKKGIMDHPMSPKSIYSQFSSNTNILFAELSHLKKAIHRAPFPGLIINFQRKQTDEAIGRLESTMQNISDAFIEKKRKPIEQGQFLRKTFITYNHRHKTISTTKKAWVEGSKFTETPENCFYDLMHAHYELLTDYCHFALPIERSLEEVLSTFPPFVFLFHPTLGPLFEDIAKKLRYGSLKEGSEWRMEVANSDIQNLSLSGSLLIRSDSTPSRSAQCTLHNVDIRNRGVDWDHSRPFWKGHYQRNESVEILIHGNGKFIGKDLILTGSHFYEVDDGQQLTLLPDGTIERKKC